MNFITRARSTHARPPAAILFLLAAAALAVAAAPAAATDFTYEIVSGFNGALKTPPVLTVSVTFSAAVADESAQAGKINDAILAYVKNSIQKGSLNLDKAMATFNTDYAAADKLANKVDRKNKIDAALNKLNTTLRKLPSYQSQFQKQATDTWARNRATTQRSITATATMQPLGREFELNLDGGGTGATAPAGGLTIEQREAMGLPPLNGDEYYLPGFDLAFLPLPNFSNVPPNIECPRGEVTVRITFSRKNEKGERLPAYVSSYYQDDIEMNVILPLLQPWMTKLNNDTRPNLEAWGEELKQAVATKGDDTKRNKAVADVLAKINKPYYGFVEDVSESIPVKVQNYWKEKADAVSRKNNVEVETFVEFDGFLVPKKLTGFAYLFKSNPDRKAALERFPRFRYRDMSSLAISGDMYTVSSRIRFIWADNSHIDEPDRWLEFTFDIPIKFGMNAYLIMFDKTVTPYLQEQSRKFGKRIAEVNDQIAKLEENSNRDAEAQKLVKGLQLEYDKALDETLTGLSQKVQTAVDDWRKMQRDNVLYQVKVGLKTTGNVLKIGYAIAKLVLTGGTDVTAYIEIAENVISMCRTLGKRFDDIRNSAKRVKKALDDLSAAVNKTDASRFRQFLNDKETIKLTSELDAALQEFNMKLLKLNNEVESLITTLTGLLDVQDEERLAAKADTAKKAALGVIYQKTNDLIDKIIQLNMKVCDNLDIATRANDAIRDARTQVGMDRDGVVLSFFKEQLASISAKDIILKAASTGVGLTPFKEVGEIVDSCISLAGEIKDAVDDFQTLGE